jgi:hypothetical protein
MKSLVERAVGALNAEIGVEHQQWLSHCVDNVLRVAFNVYDERLLIH